MSRKLNSLFGFAATLGVRRARRDAALLLTVIAVLASSVFLAIALPRLMLSAVDTGAQEAVETAGRDTDLEIRTDVGTPTAQLRLTSAETAVQLANDIPGRLPPTFARVYPTLYLTVLSSTTTVRPEGTTTGPRIAFQLGMLSPATEAATTLTDGSLPSAPRVTEGVEPDGTEVKRTEIDIVLSAEAAEAASLSIGDVLEFPDADSDNVVAVVSGIIAPVEADSKQWKDMPMLWGPTQNDTGSSVGLTALTSVAGITAAETLFDNPFTATLRLPADSAAFSSELIEPVNRELSLLRVDSTSLSADSGAELVVRSSFDTALEDYPARARSAVAQMLVLISGVLGVASAVVMLLSRLIVVRRSAELALERARGASLASIVTRSLLESILASAIAGAIGVGVAIALWGATAVSPIGVALVLAVGVFAAPVQSAILIARADRSGRRTAANRADRREVERRGRSRRIVFEAFILVVAGAALFAVRTRGLLQTRTDGVDPLLAAAPLLLAIGVTVIVLRVYPFFVRLAMNLGRRTRGALGTIGAMQAQGALAVLPLAALTLAIALVVSGGLLVETVRDGQADASWQRTGAEARVEGAFSNADVDAIAAADGVTAAAGVLTIHETRVSVGAETALVTVFAVNRSYGDVLAQLPPVGGVAGDHDISGLFGAVEAGDPLPILIDPSLARKLSGDVTLTVAGETREAIDAHVVGTFDGGADGYERGPFIYIDRTALTGKVAFTVEVNELLVMGPGAVAAADSLDETTFSRAQWLVDRQHQALVSGVNVVMLASTGAVALLALIGLVASVLAGSRSRRRSLSLLRTLGMSSKLGWWLALSELAPVVIAAVIGGIVAGVGIILVLGPSFGLETLAGGIQPPALSISPWVIGAVAVGAIVLALVAMLVEVVAHRRDRLSDVLRVGESV